MNAAPELETRPRPRLLSLQGRLCRARYVAYTLGSVVIAFMLLLLAGMLMHLTGKAGQMLYTIFAVLLVYVALPLFCVVLTVKRAHDFNRGGWLALLLIVPVINVMFWFIPGSRGDNAYGPRPEPAPAGVRIAAFALPVLLVAGYIAADNDPAPQERQAPSTTLLKPYTP